MNDTVPNSVIVRSELTARDRCESRWETTWMHNRIEIRLEQKVEQRLYAEYVKKAI